MIKFSFRKSTEKMPLHPYVFETHIFKIGGYSEFILLPIEN